MSVFDVENCKYIQYPCFDGIMHSKITHDGSVSFDY